MSSDKVGILLIGNGGREHALARTLARSPMIEDKNVLCAIANNPGIARDGWKTWVTNNVFEDGDRVQGMVNTATRITARTNGRLLTVVGPEQLLADGIVDEFRSLNLPIIGPTKAGARIEADKAFALGLMHHSNIPTGRYRAFTPNNIHGIWKAEDFALSALQEYGRVVIKANGLAAGKGVRICACEDDVRQAMYDMLVTRKYGGDTVVVMEYLGDGQELSVKALVDRNGHIAMLGAAQDHKRLLDGDQGPNTGGMGAYSPVPFVDGALMAEVRSRIIEPMVRAMAANGTPFTGFLYAGLIMTDDGPKVVEWNCRLGDPEAQVILPLLKTDLMELLLAADAGRLDEVPVGFCPGAATCVVLASEGYPEKPIVGRPITGIEQAEAMEGVSVFHAGTMMADGQLVTAGGRVVGVTAIGPDVRSSIARAYAAAELIQFEGKQFRKDIGQKAL